MIDIKDKSHCCGCGACVQRCPKQCITMLEDEEGFLYPQVDKAVCVDCGLCEKVCPVINQAEPKEPLNVYAAKNKDLQKRELSSSGGLFIALAEKVIEKGGVVFGVVFDGNWEAHHVAATTIEELQPIMRSKYMQSRTENTFAEAERYLKEGREVMYTGTSCQIAALKLFLRKEYENLLAVDLICHGVPSPGVWRRYLKEELEKSARSAATGKNTVLGHSLKSMPVITDVSFREKSRSDYDWQKFGFVLWGKSADKADQNSVLSSYMHKENPFVKAFLWDIILRTSCYACPAKGGTSRADITIADFWGIEDVFPEFADASGVGLAIVHTVNGEMHLSNSDILSKEASLAEAMIKNSVYNQSVQKPNSRAKFFTEFSKGSHVTSLLSNYAKASACCLFVKKLKTAVKKLMFR